MVKPVSKYLNFLQSIRSFDYSRTLSYGSRIKFLLLFLRKRLPRPAKAELEVYSTMEWCWEHDPAKRPKFSELFKIFSDNPEYSNLKELLLTQDLQKLGMWRSEDFESDKQFIFFLVQNQCALLAIFIFQQSFIKMWFVKLYLNSLFFTIYSVLPK